MNSMKKSYGVRRNSFTRRKNAGFEISIENIFHQFDNLKKAVIDASSVIYAIKSGFFSLLTENVSLITIPEILEEIDSRDVKIQVVALDGLTGATDQKLVACAFQLNLPIISEDRKILRAAFEKKMDYFNSLMMLNFLFYRRLVSEQEYRSYLENLREIAWYGNEIWEFGERLNIHIRDSFFQPR